MGDHTPAEPLRPLAPIVAHWQTSGTVVDENGAPVMAVSGTDEYVRDGAFHADGDGVRNTLTVAPDGASMAAAWERRLDDGTWCTGWT